MVGWTGSTKWPPTKGMAVGPKPGSDGKTGVLGTDGDAEEDDGSLANIEAALGGGMVGAGTEMAAISCSLCDPTDSVGVLPRRTSA